MTLKERIAEIVEECFIHTPPSSGICEYKLEYAKATALILTAVRESVPKKNTIPKVNPHHPESLGAGVYEYWVGWNACIDQINKELE